MGISSLIKYFDRRVTANMIVSIISIILGIILIFVSKNVMYIFFKKLEYIYLLWLFLILLIIKRLKIVIVLLVSKGLDLFLSFFNLTNL